MADSKPKNKMSQEDKRFYVNQGLKVALVVYGVYTINKLFTPQKGRTDRLKFNYPNTQKRRRTWGSGPDDFDYVQDPWHPKSLASRLHTAMNQANIISDAGRTELSEEVGRLGIDRARYLHNYWLKEVDSVTTLYRWIEGEFSNKMPAAHIMLERAGANF